MHFTAQLILGRVDKSWESQALSRLAPGLVLHRVLD